MESDAFDCDAKGCVGRATWLVWLAGYPTVKFFACGHDVHAMMKAVGVMNTVLKMGEIQTARIDDVLITNPRLLRKPTT